MGSLKKPEMTVGDIFLELERLLDILIDKHDFQWGDILYWVFGHLKIHRPDAQEQYIAGGNPAFEYGPKKEVVWRKNSRPKKKNK